MSPLGKTLNGKIPNKFARDAEDNFCCLPQITSVHFTLLSTQIAWLITVFWIANNFGLICKANIAEEKNLTVFR